VEPDVLEITALKILTYLNNHPDAKDPIEGVVEYWIKQTNKDYTTAVVNRALRSLIKKDIVEVFDSGGREIYKLKADKGEEVSRLLDLLTPEAG
jgi:hypothetical protein